MKFQYLFALTGYLALKVELFENALFAGKCQTLDVKYCSCSKVDPKFGVSSVKWSEGNGGYIVFATKDKERFWTVDDRAFPSNFAYDRIDKEVKAVCWYPVWENCPGKPSRATLEKARQA